MMPQISYDSGLARVECDGQILGAAFCIAERFWVTCAHVVDKKPRIDLTYLARTESDPVSAEVIHADAGQDVAILKCDVTVPGANPLPMSRQKGGEGFHALGFPKGRRDGDTVRGTILRQQTNGWVQLEAEGARRIEERFSGSAVWSLEQRVAVGMVVAFYENDESAYMIPCGILAEILRRQGIEVAGSRASLAHGPGRRARPVTPLLPYLADRSDQKEQLEEKLAEHRATQPRRPFVALIHGDEHEAHDRFVDCLESTVLPAILRPERAQLKKLRWVGPSEGLDGRLARLSRSLAKAITGKLDADPEKIIEEIARHRSPLALAAFTACKDWRRHEPKLIERWLRFLGELPDLPHGQLFLVFLSIRYRGKPVEPGAVDEPRLPSLLHRFRRARYLRKLEEANRRARGFVSDLSLDQFPGLTSVRLEELRGVRESDVENWIEEDFARFCLECRDAGMDSVLVAEALRPRIQQHFRRWEERTDSDRIPMSQLAPWLRTELNRHIEQREWR